MSTVIVGVGNAFRRDDGAGPAVAERLAGRLPEGVAVSVVPGDAAAVLAAFAGAAWAVLVDATSSGVPPGTVRCFEAADGPLPAGLAGVSSHGMGVAEAVELARALGCLPPRLTVYGIEGADFGMGEGLTPPVAAAVEAVAAVVRAQMKKGFSKRTPSTFRSCWKSSV